MSYEDGVLNYGILVAMGYDLHITRAFFWPHSERYPIRAEEVTALAEREADLTLVRGESYPTLFYMTVGTDDWLLFRSGYVSTKNPRPSLIRRIVEIGRLLDAWVIGDDGDIYGWDGDVTTRQPTQEEEPQPACYLVGSASRLSWEAPIAERAWLELVSAQPDFEVMPWVKARLPSGLRSIPCPPVAYWTDHPSGRPVPFFFDCDHVEVARDSATLARLRELAPSLDARVLHDDDVEPA